MLWVRSQDKTRLVKINSLKYEEYQDNHVINGYYTNEADNYDLGVYSSKERALEVLDEIQEKISFAIVYNPIVEEDKNPTYRYKKFKQVGENIEIINPNNVIYEMPQD